jgi:hypothetical protein
MPIDFDLGGCICGTSFWILPGIVGGLAIVAGLYFGSSRHLIASKVSICVGWLLGSIIAGSIGTIIRYLFGRIKYRSVIDINILPDLVGLLFIGLLMGLIGSYFTFTNVLPASQYSQESDAA